MELSVFLVKAWGLYVTIVCLVFLLNKRSLQRLVNSVHDPNTVLSYSLMALVVGVLSTLSHNIWSSDWRVLVTLFGWASLLKGFTLLLHPEYSIKILKALKFQRRGGSIYIYLFVGLIIGLYLLLVGFSY